MVINFSNANVVKKIRSLQVSRIIDVSVGSDHIDLYAKRYYNDYSYWVPLSIFNNILNPFNLVDQGVTKFKLFNKTDYQELLREISK